MTSQKMTKSRNEDKKGPQMTPPEPVNRFLGHVELRAWTDAEKELDVIRQESDGSQWSRGYVKALEGLMLTYRNNDDKYVYLPKALANRTEESIGSLRKEFSEFVANELHGEYDRGYFKALEDYVAVLADPKDKPANVDTHSSAAAPQEQQATLDHPAPNMGQG